MPTEDSISVGSVLALLGDVDPTADTYSQGEGAAGSFTERRAFGVR